jgi:hypothetical protein
MKDFGQKIGVVVLGTFALFMIGNIVFSPAQAQSGDDLQNEQTYIQNFCFDGQVNEIDTSTLRTIYTEKTNDFFNENIKEIMENPGLTQNVPSAADYSDSPQLCNDPTDYTCKMISVCQDNSSAFCVGVKALGFAPEKYKNYKKDVLDQEFGQLKYSYFCYKAALESKKNDVLEETGQKLLGMCGKSDWEGIVPKDLCDQKASYDAQTDPIARTAELNKLNALLKKYGYDYSVTVIGSNLAQKAGRITEEVARAKRALDFTLDAYSQLRDAWKLHIKYIDVYQELVKYRDNLVAIRKQTDVFPFRFIDASTTQCK